MDKIQYLEGHDNITKDDKIIVGKYRNRVIFTNRIIVFIVALVSIFGTIWWSWFSIPICLITGYAVSVINSLMASNQIKRLSGLSYTVQADIWYNMRADYDVFRKNKRDGKDVF
jgi:hypothetical protein